MDIIDYDEARFWSNVDRILEGDFCWDWTAGTNNCGYGSYGRFMAHRVAYELLYGPIPEGMDVMHRETCKKTCMRHLTLGTRSENVRSALKAGKRGQHRRKLTIEDAIQIKQRIVDGHRTTDIANDFGVTLFHISNIKKGHSWAHVPWPQMAA